MDYAEYEQLIKENIEYDQMVSNAIVDKPQRDELVDIMAEVVCTQRKTVRIAGDIRNIKQYLRAVLFNAPSAMDSDYAAKVAHDMAS